MSTDPHVLDSLVSLQALGWPVRLRSNQLTMSMTSGFCGVEVAGQLGARVLDLLRQTQVEGPVAEIPRPRQRNYLLIVETDTVPDGHRIRSVGGELWCSSDDIALPPSSLRDGVARWVVPPDMHHGFLPTLSTVVWALETVGHPRHTQRVTDRVHLRNVVAGGRIGSGD